MNDEDKEAFEKWYNGENNIICKGLHHEHREAWQAACEYMRNKSNPLDVLSLYEKLERERAENKKNTGTNNEIC